MKRKYSIPNRKELMCHEPQGIELTLEMPNELFNMLKFPSQAKLHPRLMKYYARNHNHYVRWIK